MRAGRLCHRLVVERPVPTRDSTGDEVIEWRSIGTVWAAIEPTRGSEAMRSGQILAELDTKIVIRWSPNVAVVSAKYRLRHAEQSNPTTYNIAAPPIHVNLGQREIELMCKSGVNAG